mmetsp:Transcript_32584/g.59739  ORF Transcript_32584/g.59739 Transcript_32584/m.59739 type:complete len:119 (-) Transcript_32584:307-663(-)
MLPPMHMPMARGNKLLTPPPLNSFSPFTISQLLSAPVTTVTACVSIVLELLMTLIGRYFVSISTSASDAGDAFEERRLDRGVFAIGIVVVLLLDLGIHTPLGIDASSDLGGELFFLRG